MKRILSLSLLCLSLVFSGKNYAVPGDLPTINSFNSTWTILEFISEQLETLNITVTIENLTVTGIIDIDLNSVFTVLEEIEDDIFESLTVISDKFNSTWTILEFITEQIDTLQPTVTIENVTVTALVNIDLGGVFTVLEEIEDDIFESLTIISDKFNSTWTILAFISQQLDNLTISVTVENLTVTGLINIDLNSVFTVLETIEDHVICFQSQPISAPVTITQPGTYCLINDIAGGLVIASDDVTVDLQGFVISGGTTGIEVGAFSNITIKNGTVRNASGNGIQAIGSSDLELLKITLENNGSNGILLTNVNSSLIQSCLATRNDIAGFSLQDSNNNTFKNCSAIANGINGTSSAFGFVSDNGRDNIFECCTAQANVTTQATANFIAAGFALTSSEVCSKIINCESFDNTATGSSVAYGIFLQSTQTQDFIVTDSVLFSLGLSGTINSVSWAPSGTILAGGNDMGDLEVYSFNNNMLSFITSVTSPARTIRSIDWSPDGQFLAEGSGTNVIVYSFNGAMLTIQDSQNPGVSVNSVQWSPNGQFLAVSTGGSLLIYSFDGSSLTFITSVGSLGGNISTWSPDGQLIAVYAALAVNNLQVYSFDGSSLTLLSSIGAPTLTLPAGLDWSPQGQFIAISSGLHVQAYLFENSVLTLAAQSIPLSTAHGLNWYPDGQALAVGENRGLIQEYTFKQTSTLPLLTTIQIGFIPPSNPVNAVSWSPNGAYLAAGSIDPTNLDGLLIVYAAAISFPANNVIVDNVVYCNGITAGSGVGILGSAVDNLIINNVVYQNTVNYQLSPAVNNV